MVAFSKGLIIGSDNGLFALWLKNENTEEDHNNNGGKENNNNNNDDDY
jgi:hypothetical protein